jgi:hypothetical protein
MATDVPADTILATMSGETRPITEWTTNFHLALMVLDPFTYESSWILETAARVLRTYAEADCRCSFLVTCGAEDAERFLGPYAKDFLVFCDPDRLAVKGMGLERLPAFVHVNIAHAVEASAEGWEPDQWRQVAENLARVMSWHRPTIPATSDPVPFEGTPALG